MYQVGWERQDGYRSITINYKRYLAHRLAWLFVYGNIPDSDIDHIDGNPRNNAIANLRLASPSQNIANGKHRTNNNSGYKGVHYCRSKKKFIARLCVNYKKKYLGAFDTAEEAFKVYSAEAQRTFGDFFREK